MRITRLRTSLLESTTGRGWPDRPLHAASFMLQTPPYLNAKRGGFWSKKPQEPSGISKRAVHSSNPEDRAAPPIASKTWRSFSVANLGGRRLQGTAREPAKQRTSLSAFPNLKLSVALTNSSQLSHNLYLSRSDSCSSDPWNRDPQLRKQKDLEYGSQLPWPQHDCCTLI